MNDVEKIKALLADAKKATARALKAEATASESDYEADMARAAWREAVRVAMAERVGD